MLLNITVAVAFIIVALIFIRMVNREQREQALEQAESKAMVMLDKNLATHTYFTHQLKPNVMELTDPIRSWDYFDPAWMSSTYAVREMEEYFKNLNEEDYYYKECAINARSPENEADEYERAFIEELNTNPELTERSDIRTIDDKPYFVTLRRGEAMEAACLQCHSTPENAPGDMVDVYGSERSFNRLAGEVVSAISVRIPLETAYEDADRLSWELSGLFLLFLGGLFAIQYSFSHQWLFKPLDALRLKALDISTNRDRIGEEIPLPFGKELSELTHAFNAMSVSLRKERDLLEARVKERTSQLEETNEQLQIQMAEIERLQENLRKQALRDPLTGLYNRRYLSEAIEREISTAKREEKDLSVIAIDLDHFKDVNDTFGHQVGDQYLIIFAALLRSRIRKSDIACRYGGEEFLLVLPGISLEDAVKRSEEIRREYANTTLPGRGINKKVTISIGIATYPLHGKESEDIIVKADKALYMSKENGRNRVTVWEEKG
jgi:diguanylate cyclase (GGDEF)-like protein